MTPLACRSGTDRQTGAHTFGSDPRGWPGTTSTGSSGVRPRKPRPSTTLDSAPESTPVTRNEVCIKPGMLQIDWNREVWSVHSGNQVPCRTSIYRSYRAVNENPKSRIPLVAGSSPRAPETFRRRAASRRALSLAGWRTGQAGAYLRAESPWWRRKRGLGSLRGACYAPVSAGPGARRRGFDGERPTSER